MTTDRPLISIVTVVRNAAARLEQTLRSVIEQSYTHREHVVVDGASTDGTVEVIRRFDEHLARWISEPDLGIADAFNKAIDLTRGDTLLFLNAGDTLYDPDVLRRVAASPVFARDDLDRIIVYGDAWGIHDDGERRSRCDHTRLDERCALCHQATFIGSALQREENYDRRIHVEMDYDLWLRYRSRGVPFVKVDELICNYYFDGLSSDPAVQLHVHIEDEIIKMLNAPGRWGMRDALRIPNRVLRFRTKKAVEAMVGKRAYRQLKRLFGR